MFSIKTISIVGLILIATVVGFDIYLAADNIKGNTWSEVIRLYGRHLNLLPWACGVLCGHWFHPDWTHALFGQPGSIAVLVWLTFIVTGLGFGSLNIPMWTFCLIGMITGCWFWPSI